MTIIDVIDDASFAMVPPCADPAFDHRTCDYWEDAERGTKKARSIATTQGGATAARPTTPAGLADNPFAVPKREQAFNPFLEGVRQAARNPFLDDLDRPAENPFLPGRPLRASVPTGAPRKLALLGRGLAAFGSYAKVLLVHDRPVAYAQFGPLSAYPRALRLRELYPQLPESPSPAVITCIATTAEARGQGLGQRLIGEVCDDLNRRGFAAVEAYPEVDARPDSTSGATPRFWESVGFEVAVDDERFPVYRRELG